MDDDPVTVSEIVEEGVDVSLPPSGDPPPARAPELPAIARLGRYELLGRIAVGGMAEIFLARERAAAAFGSRQLVVKIMRPQLDGDAHFQTMFLNEGRVALRLQHPNICHVYECGVEAGRCFIAMEHVQGVTLRDLMKQAAITGQPLPPAVVVKLAAQIAEALHSAHCAKDASGQPLGVVHRDVSPQNVMIGYDGVVKLLDFGVAHAQTELSYERSGTIKGKLGYLAPEQCLGRPVDARTDVFALGICMWEALTGRRLYKRSGDAPALASIVNEDAPDLNEMGADVPEELAAIVRRTLARAPEDRFASAAELQYALEQFLTDRRELVNGARVASLVSHLFGGEQPLDLDRSPEVVRWIDEEPPPPRRRAWWIAAPVALAVLGIALFAWAQREPETAHVAIEPPTTAAGWRPVEPEPERRVAEPREVEPSGEAEGESVSEAEQEPPRAVRRRRPPPTPGGFVEDPGF